MLLVILQMSILEPLTLRTKSFIRFQRAIDLLHVSCVIKLHDSKLHYSIHYTLYR